MDSYLNTTLRNIAWFKKAHDTNELDIKPPFQRNPVWVTRQKSYLIDSILNGFPIPEIYMQETISDRGEARYIVVDGQQRIRSVIEFIEGEFTLDAKDSPEWADMSFDDLSSEEKRRIFEYNFVIRILPPMLEVELRGIFQRINKNTVALNQQELRQATYWGPFIKLMNRISDKSIWPELGVFSANDVRRMLDVEFISELTIAMLHGFQNKKQNLDKYYQVYEQDFEEETEVEERFTIILREIHRILPDITTTRWRKKSDFYTLFLVFNGHIECLPFNRATREQARESLVIFSEQLTEFTKAEKLSDFNFLEDVIRYSSGTRATTDIGERRRRHQSLDNFLQAIWC